MTTTIGHSPAPQNLSIRPRGRSGPASVAGRKIFALIALLAVVLTACSSSGEVPDEVAAAFDVDGNWIADLTDPGDEPFDGQRLLSSIGQARAAGTNLRIVVAGSQDERPSVSAIVDKYGGTVLVYQANNRGFDAASKDMSRGQTERAALGRASDQSTISESVAGFVLTLTEEGIEGGSWFNTLLKFVLLPLAALFMLFMLLRYLRARAAASKRVEKFEERRSALAGWASQLQPEIDTLRGPFALASDQARASLGELDSFARDIGPKIAAADNQADLDGAEMRVGRAFIKLRELRKAANV